MSQLVQIQIPFEKKKQARDLNVLFNKNDRRWYVEENRLDEISSLIFSNTSENQITNTEDCNTNEENNFTNLTYNNVLQNLSPTMILNKKDWEETLKEDDTILLTYAIKEFGMPKEEELRVKILKRLSLKKATDYPITYDGLRRYSESFNELYPKERIQKLIETYITGDRPYQEDIRRATISEEDRALMFFVIPL